LVSFEKAINKTPVDCIRYAEGRWTQKARGQKWGEKEKTILTYFKIYTINNNGLFLV
jgi:hypothetical protein